MTSPLRQYYKNRQQQLIDALIAHIEYESPTADKAAVDQYSGFVKAQFEALDPDTLIVHPRDAVGNLVEAQWGTQYDAPPVVIIGHMDTVHPVGMLAINPPRVEDGKLYGPGSYDMKGSIMCALAAIEGLLELEQMPARPVIYLATSDEETGSWHSKDYLVELTKGAALVLIIEAALSDGALKTYRKAPGVFRLIARGKRAHSGIEPEAGVNAIDEMAQQILKIQSFADFPNGTTLTSTLISGGTASNVVPDECRLTVDARVGTMDEMKRIEKVMLALKPYTLGAQLEVTGGFNRPPMERNETMVRTFDRAQEIVKEHGITLRHGESGGGSDGNFVAAQGTPLLDGVGPAGEGAHTKSEAVYVSALERATTQIAALLRDW